MTYKELENKIKSMTAKEIILAMVDSLKNPVTEIDMYNWGQKRNSICYGCAATNTICRLGDLDPQNEIVINHQVISFGFYQRLYIIENYFLGNFEDAIDALRIGDIYRYNSYAFCKFAEIEIPDFDLPCITTENYNDPRILQVYVDLANFQK